MEQTNVFRLDNYFTRVLESALTAKHDYPGLRSLLNYYKSILGGIQSKAKCGYTSSNDQFYTSTINLVDSDFYTITWAVSQIKHIVSENGLPTTFVPVERVINLVNTSSINPDHLPYSLGNKDPVVLAQYMFGYPDHVLLDGNHRIVSRYLDKQDLIQAHILTPRQHIRAMAAEMFRVLYKVHANLLLICSYMNDIISADIMNRSQFDL